MTATCDLCGDPIGGGDAEQIIVNVPGDNNTVTIKLCCSCDAECNREAGCRSVADMVRGLLVKALKRICGV